MTTHIAPVFIARFQGSSGVIFRSWSAHPYDTGDALHPSMTMEYMDALQQVMHETERYIGFVDITTDYCHTSTEERGDRLYLITLRDSPFSPVFFLEEDAESYMNYLWNTFIVQRPYLSIREATHSLL